MTPEQLLKPRYKVIATYPNMSDAWDSSFKVGRILTEPNINWAINEIGFDPEDYPHLFRRLHWWEERDKEYLPPYVRIGEWVWKVDRWIDGVLDIMPSAKSDYEDGRGDNYRHLSAIWHFRAKDSRPATEEEYNTFIQSQKEAQP